jgi:hypothetical protein
MINLPYYESFINEKPKKELLPLEKVMAALNLMPSLEDKLRLLE